MTTINKDKQENVFECSQNKKTKPISFSNYKNIIEEEEVWDNQNIHDNLNLKSPDSKIRLNRP